MGAYNDILTESYRLDRDISAIVDSMIPPFKMVSEDAESWSVEFANLVNEAYASYVNDLAKSAEEMIRSRNANPIFTEAAVFIVNEALSGRGGVIITQLIQAAKTLIQKIQKFLVSGGAKRVNSEMKKAKGTIGSDEGKRDVLKANSIEKTFNQANTAAITGKPNDALKTIKSFVDNDRADKGYSDGELRNVSMRTASRAITKCESVLKKLTDDINKTMKDLAAETDPSSEKISAYRSLLLFYNESFKIVMRQYRRVLETVRSELAPAKTSEASK